MFSAPFSELKLGQSAVSRGRTITEADVVNFCMLTGNWLELHSNAEYAKQSLFGQRIVQGTLVFSIGNALLPFDFDYIEAFYGTDNLRFLAPVFIGDTIWSRAEIADLRPKTEGRGVMSVDLRVSNQRSKVVMKCVFHLLMRGERRSQSFKPKFDA